VRNASEVVREVGVNDFRVEQIAGWGLHPLESAALSRRTPTADILRREFSYFFPRFAFPADVLAATAVLISDLKAPASVFSPPRISIARLTFPPRLELKSLAGSFKKAPLAKVTFATNLYVSPVQMMPSCDQTGMVEQYSL
jgi:hypothetical protein